MNVLEHRIERGLRQIADRATPSPNAWNSILIRIANQNPDTETEIIMLTEADTSTPAPTHNRRWLLVAAAALVALVVAGIALVNNADDDQSPPPTAVATVAPATTIATKTVQFDVVNTNIPVTFKVPADDVTSPVSTLWMDPTHWTVDDRWGAHKGAEADVVGVQFAVISNIFADGCQHSPLAPAAGPSVDDLAQAWESLPQYSATPAVDVTVDGYPGLQVGFTVPEFNVSECQDDIFLLWGVGADPSFYAAPGGIHIEQRILDVNGTRLLISEYYTPTSTPQDRAALAALLASIQIG